MGQAESSEQEQNNGDNAQHRISQGGAMVNGTLLTAGYHVVQVQPHSPAAHAGLCSYFDFILAANGHSFHQEDDNFKTILSQSVNTVVNLTVFNLRDEQTRYVQLTPQTTSTGQQVVGISIRFTDFQTVDEHVWHVLDVYPRSPAVDAGLVARSDYIVGTPDLQFTDAEDFFTYVDTNMGQSIRLYVYSVATDSVRLVSITPNNQWGGNGCLGCDVGFGYLHRIPKRIHSPAAHAALSGDEPPASRASPASHPRAPHAHATPPDSVVERRLHPLMIPTSAGFQSQPPSQNQQQQPSAAAAVPPVAAATPVAAAVAAPARAVVDAVGNNVSRYATPPAHNAPPAATPATYKAPSFLTMSDDDINNKPPPGPPPTTPYIAAAPKQAAQYVAPPTRFMPTGVSDVPATQASPVPAASSPSPSTVAPAAPAAAAQTSSFQMPPPGAGDMFSNIQL